MDAPLFYPTHQFNDHLHEAEKINLPESDGSIIETAISKVVDVEIFVSEIVVMVT